MSEGPAITLYLTAALLSGILGAIIAHAKRRGAGFWTVACFLVPPLLLVVMLLPKRPFAKVRERHPDNSLASDNLDDF